MSLIFFQMGHQVIRVRQVRKVRLAINYICSVNGTPSNVGKICKKGKIKKTEGAGKGLMALGLGATIEKEHKAPRRG
jgi:hypothetical protein